MKYLIILLVITDIHASINVPATKSFTSPSMVGAFPNIDDAIAKMDKDCGDFKWRRVGGGTGEVPETKYSSVIFYNPAKSYIIYRCVKNKLIGV